uniref:Cell division protein FtsL n=1 Tax=uncultured Flavobacteriia bacterium TaxID=212695 RepID=H6RFW4_9BACT|nr:cell division protein FtsL [uncultured bacterium]CCF99925.1 conserved hypothetical protein [uncultured Flavobacteriia bacterium]
MSEEQKTFKLFRPFIQLVNGNVLTRERVVQALPFLIYMAFMGLVYISNGFLAESAVRAINKTTSEIKELRSEYITSKSDLIYESKQSQVVDLLNERDMGLKESFDPPKKIVIKD